MVRPKGEGIRGSPNGGPGGLPGKSFENQPQNLNAGHFSVIVGSKKTPIFIT